MRPRAFSTGCLANLGVAASLMLVAPPAAAFTAASPLIKSAQANSWTERAYYCPHKYRHRSYCKEQKKAAAKK